MSREREDDRRDGRDDRDDPGRPDRRDLEAARRKVKGPAIALMVTSLLSLVGIGLGALQYAFLMEDQFEAERRNIDANPGLPPQGKKDVKEFLDVYERIVKVALPVDWFVVAITSGIIFLGASKMKNLSGRGWARTSAILAMIPCLSGCCVLGLPFGIWAIMVLSDGEVKRGFESAATGTDRDDDFR